MYMPGAVHLPESESLSIPRRIAKSESIHHANTTQSQLM